MVVIPVKLYPATKAKDISFVTLHGTCHTRIRQRRYCPYDEMQVELEDIVRGYEYAKDQYVVMEKSGFEGLPVPSTHTIEIAQFIDLASIDPLYFERSYVLEPDGVGEKPYYLLKRALESTGRVAIGKVSLRQKEHPCCLRPYEGGIVMATLYYSDEIRVNQELNLQDEAAISEPEIQMAITLVDQLTEAFDPNEFHDEYRSALERVIESKLGAAQPVTVASTPPKGKVADLMEALKASIEATKKASKKERSTAVAGARSEPRQRKKATAPEVG